MSHYSQTPFVQYLAAQTPLPVGEDTLCAILFERGLESDVIVGDVSKKERDLCKADMWMWCADAPSVQGSTSDADGGWSHKEGGMQMTKSERASLRHRAREIYKKYGEYTGKSSIQIHSSGVRLW